MSTTARSYMAACTHYYQDDVIINSLLTSIECNDITLIMIRSPNKRQMKIGC